MGFALGRDVGLAFGFAAGLRFDVLFDAVALDAVDFARVDFDFAAEGFALGFAFAFAAGLRAGYAPLLRAAGRRAGRARREPTANSSAVSVSSAE